MQISFCKSVEVESAVDVSVEDITCAMSELLAIAEDVCQCVEGASDQCKRHHVQRLVSGAWQCLAGMSDEMIGHLTMGDKQIIIARLKEQAERYSA